MVLNIYRVDDGYGETEVLDSDITDIKQAETTRLYYIQSHNLDPDNVQVVQYKA